MQSLYELAEVLRALPSHNSQLTSALFLFSSHFFEGKNVHAQTAIPRKFHFQRVNDLQICFIIIIIMVRSRFQSRVICACDK